MKKHTTAKNILLFLAWSIVLIGVFVTLHKNPEIIDNFKWLYAITVAAILTPLTITCNALGFIQSAKIIGQEQKFRPSLRLVSLGTLANQLPLPAAFMMRVGVLKAGGARLLDSIYATLTISIIWFGCALVISASAAFYLKLFTITVTLFIAGSSALIYGAWQFRNRPVNQFFPILTLGILIPFLEAIRLYICFKSIGITPSISECLLFTSASAISNIVTIIPGGIGIREYGSAVLSALTNIEPSHTLLAVTINRFAGLVGTSSVLLIIFFSHTSSESLKNSN